MAAAHYLGECLCHGVTVIGAEKYRTDAFDTQIGKFVPVIQVVDGQLHDIPISVAELVPAETERQ
jgi:hypothetical protein